MVVGPNIPPIAVPGPSQTVSQFTSAIFDASGSSDPDGAIVSFDWEFGDGATASGSSTGHLYGVPGIFTVRLTVTDDGGLTGRANTSVTVLQATPEEHIQMIQVEVLDLDLKANVEGSLVSKVQNVTASLDKDNIGAAINQLGAFVNEMEALIQSGGLTQPDGERLIDLAQSVIDQLDPPPCDPTVPPGCGGGGGGGL